MRFDGFEPELYRPVPDGTSIDTTELDWRHRARQDGWALIDGHWQHPDSDVVYDDEDWVYLGSGHWEDAEVVTWTPEQLLRHRPAPFSSLTSTTNCSPH
jgi:hypothetical protein